MKKIFLVILLHNCKIIRLLHDYFKVYLSSISSINTVSEWILFFISYKSRLVFLETYLYRFVLQINQIQIDLFRDIGRFSLPGAFESNSERCERV